VTVARWKRRTDVLERRLLGGVLLLPVAGDDVTFLGGTGGQMWGLLTERRSTSELADELALRYAGDASTIRSDIEAVLAELERGGLVAREA
jgi:hypothetical protein